MSPLPYRPLIIRSLFAPLLIAIGLLAASCSDNDEPIPSPTTPADSARRTVLIYMAAQNTLGSNGWQSRDSVEIMLGRQYVPDDVRLLVFIDGASMPRLYRVMRGQARPVAVRTWANDVNSTSPAVLQDVLEWTRKNFPAREYGLVMWSHADGWIPATNKDYAATRRIGFVRPSSFGIDDGAHMGTDKGSQMDVVDMASSIAAAGMHLRFLFFDACLMQNIEVDYALKDVTDLVIGAPMSTPAAGANYTHQLRDGLFSDDPTRIVDVYRNDIADPDQQNTYGDYGIVISAIRTDRLPALAAAFRRALPASQLVGRTSPDMSGVFFYQTYSWNYFYRPHNFDAAESISRLFPEPHRSELLRALAGAVARKAATSSFWIGPGGFSYADVPLGTYSGVSLFVPQTAYTTNAAHCPHGDHNVNFTATSWYRDAGWAQTGW